MKTVLQVSFITTFVMYFLSMVGYFVADSGRRGAAGAARAAAALGWLANSAILVARVLLTGRLPLSNGYEFLISFAWGIVILYLIFERRTKFKAAGGFTLAAAWGLLACIWLFMPEQQYSVEPLMPALKSGWLTVHVLTAVVSYSAFTLACALAVVYLRRLREAEGDDDALDVAIYQAVAFGFTMLSLTIVTGAVWAEKAWGSYWSWDPKETWSLITWIVFGIYLHVRRNRGWRGRAAAVLVIAGFLIVLFTFFGVNYFLSGNHSYA